MSRHGGTNLQKGALHLGTAPKPSPELLDISGGILEGDELASLGHGDRFVERAVPTALTRWCASSGSGIQQLDACECSSLPLSPISNKAETGKADKHHSPSGG
jgi:hypothetical protein